MNIIGMIPAVLMVFGGFSTPFSEPLVLVDVGIRVFAILPMQSVTGAGTDKNGVVTGITTGGDISVAFPSGGVVIRTDLDENAPEAELKAAIYGQDLFKERECLGGNIGWDRIGHFLMDCPVAADGSGVIRIHPAGMVESDKGAGELRYNLAVQAKSWNGEKALVHLKFELETWGAKPVENVCRTLLDQDVETAAGKVLLVGFPTFREDGSGRSKGTIFSSH